MSSVRAGVSVSRAERNSEAGGATRLLFGRRGRRPAKSRTSAVKVAEAPPLPPPTKRPSHPFNVPPNVPADSEKSSSTAMVVGRVVLGEDGGEGVGGRIEICQRSILMS